MNVLKLKQIIKTSNNIVFLGGAGVSTASNIPDFRSSTGLYTGPELSPEIILSRAYFFKNPKEFYQFYKTKMIYKDAKPNPTHYALANLEQSKKLKAVITQNIDGLHQLAGSKNVLELHGSVYRNKCVDCDKFFDLDYVINSQEVPLCDKCNGLVKPEVVLYGEPLDNNILYKSIEYIKNADVFIVGGTSLTVHPAAGLVSYYEGDKLILINNSITPYDSLADYIIRDDIAKVMSKLVLNE